MAEEADQKIGYGRLGATTDSFRSVASVEPGQKSATPTTTKRRNKIILVSILSALLLLACAVSAALLVHLRNNASENGGAGRISRRKPTQSISKTCSKTRYPDLCVNSLVDFPGALSANERDLVHISVNMTLNRVGRALYGVSDLLNLPMDAHVRSAFDDCLELLGDSVDQLSMSLTSVASGPGDTGNVMTWLSGALTNHDTCTEGFEGVDSGNNVKNQMTQQLKDVSELLSNCLAIFAVSSNDDDFSGIPIQNKRRRLMTTETNGFPSWISRRERRLLETPISAMQADIIVSKDGNGTYKTITEAIKAAPQQSNRRTIIYIREGRYEEKIIKVGRKKTNLMFIGDGIDKTVITGGKSVQDGITTFHTASFAATGAGFIARDMTFENYAGPAKHQAVALRVGADHAVVYKCNIIGYQDTLYVHSQRQFFRECNIYGTVDFIFGNAAVVIQNCNIYARKPMAQQKNTITAQNRKDPNQNTGISIHNCHISATPDLEAAKGTFETYLGRPWKLYSRVVYLLSHMGDNIHPHGWLEWNGAFALDTLYYGEYMNDGPGAATGQRVKWPGYRVITSAEEASKFTVARFIYGSSWLPSTGVAFLSGLSV